MKVDYKIKMDIIYPSKAKKAASDLLIGNPFHQESNDSHNYVPHLRATTRGYIPSL
jgi:hypothetical protein